MLAWFVAVVVAALAVAPTQVVAQPPAMYLDQETFVTPGLRQTRHGYVFQTFAPRWNGQLVQVDVFLGLSTGNCTADSTATLTVSAVGATSALAAQSVTIACAALTCSGRTCTGWQTFPLAAPVAVTNGSWYQWRLDNLPTASGLVGVSPAAARHGGRASLVVSPLYATKYTQYTFKTYLDTAPPASEPLGQPAAAQIGGGGSGSGSGSDTAAGAASSNSITAGVLVPAAMIALVVVLVAGFVYVRRSQRKAVGAAAAAAAAVATARKSSAVASAGDALPTHHVRVAPAAGATTAADEEDIAWCHEPGLAAGQWATRSVHAPAAAVAVVVPGSGRRLPKAPGAPARDPAPLLHDALGAVAIDAASDC